MTTTVYYANFASPENLGKMSLVNTSPQLVLQDLLRDRVPTSENGGGYSDCSGLREVFKNSFLMTSPLDFHARWNNGELLEAAPHPDWFRPRNSSFVDRTSFDLDMSWIFFADKPLTMRSIHPYFHSTAFTPYASAVAGAYDIGKWFRAVFPSYMSFKGVTEFHLKKGDPFMYVEFLTDEKVEIKPFHLSKDLYDIAIASSLHARFFPRIPLTSRYQMFANNHLRAKILRDIQANLLT